MDETGLQALVGDVEAGPSGFKRESSGVDEAVGKRRKGDAEGDGGGGGDCKGSDDNGLLSLRVESGSLQPEAITKKRKPRARTNNPKGGWTQPEDDIILDGRKKNKSWQEITNAVNFLKDGGKARTLTAVRLRYQKVLKDRSVELTAEQVCTSSPPLSPPHPFYYPSPRFELFSTSSAFASSSASASPSPSFFLIFSICCQKILMTAEKGELAPAAKLDLDPPSSSTTGTTSSSSSSSSSAAAILVHTTTTTTT
ncbi:hypothetical protein L873DRAFT_1785984 [Choiromyces venosus 120613-1]|uniref:Myb-like domain-containing protein n=1 Tax=Choiromyces venosus 120613-1 TaxID=1336337 RepID=A0A3N4K5X6_9PEZI|nr:hypothetical protein L873DRAFT_1785984 [Choiromyces venosus 120613-1]